MKRIQTVFLALALLCAPLSFASTVSFTLVSGTVVDPNGLAYANGTITATLVISGSPVFGGAGLGVPTPPANTPYTPPTQPTGLDKNGSFSMQLADNNALLPGGSQWNFTVCSAVGTIQPAGGKGPVCFTLAAPITITGATQSISTNLNAVAPALSNIAGAGGAGTSPTQPGFLVTASPYNAKCDGSTDDTTAIQSAITAAATAHGTVIFPSATCNITSVLAIPAGTTNMGIQGQIGYGSFVQQMTPNADILDVNGTVGSTVGNLTIANMFFVRGVAYTGTPKGLSFSYCLNCIAYYVQVADSFTNWFTTNGANNTWTYVTSIGNRSTPSTGVLVSGNTSSLYIDSVNISGAHTTGMSFTGAANDSFITHLNTVAGVTTGLSITLGASDIHFINPIMDACGTNCININNSTGGSLGNSNNIEIIGCWCNSSTGASSTPAVINNSEGIHLLGGTYVERAGATVNAIYLNGGSVRNSVVGVHLTNSSGVSTSNGIVVGPSSKDNIVADNVVTAPTSGSAWNAAIYVSNAGSNNTITGNTVGGFASIGVATDISSTLNVYSGNTVDTTNITTPFYDGTSGNTISASTIAVGVVGSAQDYKSTAAITGPVPVKWDTSNANQVVVTTTADTGAGVPIGVCVNSPVLGNSCLVMTSGTVALTLGTGTCSIGNFVIVDTTTNGRVKCTGTYTAGTVIGTAQAADSTVGTAFNVAIGIR